MADSMHVWVWLPGDLSPVVAGAIHERGGEVSFEYHAGYLALAAAVSLFSELPLRAGRQRPLAGLSVPGCIHDSWPDGWAKVVIERRRLDEGRSSGDLHPFDYLRESSSDRIGALDFSDDAMWQPRGEQQATLDQLQSAASLIEAGEALAPDLAAAMQQATASGGMRPKALVRDGRRHLIAKLASRSDQRPVTNLEAVAMELAGRVGLDVAPTELTRAAGRDVLLVERFDRDADGARRSVVSAATILALDPFLGARYASYSDLADRLRAMSGDSGDTRELFARITFNVIVGNTDDHARNHAAIWDGRSLRLAPAFDICPQPRSGGESGQAMAIGRDGFRASNLAGCVAWAHAYGVDRREARDLVERQVEVVRSAWDDAADRARLTAADRRAALGGPILHPSIFYGWDDVK